MKKLTALLLCALLLLAAAACSKNPEPDPVAELPTIEAPEVVNPAEPTAAVIEQVTPAQETEPAEQTPVETENIAISELPAPATKHIDLPEVTEEPVPETETEEPYTGIALNGLHRPDITADELKDAFGVEEIYETYTANEETILLGNQPVSFGMEFTQVQCIFFDAKTTVTLTFNTEDSELMQATMENIISEVSQEYGDPSTTTTSGGTEIYNWRSDEGPNYLTMYLNTETDLKLCLTIY